MNVTEIEIITFQGGEGDCIANAVEIVGATNFASGISAEYFYIDTIHKIEDIDEVIAKAVFISGKIFHQVNIITKNEGVKDIFFDASSFHFIKVCNEDVEMIKEFMDFIN